MSAAIVNEPVLRLRVMREADLSEVMTIERRAYSFPWTQPIFRDCLRVGYCCWLLEENGRITGYGVMSVGAGEAHVLNLCVDPERRSRGYGRKILSHLVDLARRLRADTVLLEVRPSNAPALHLYHSLGFNEVGMRRDYYPDQHGREDALILALSL